MTFLSKKILISVITAVVLIILVIASLLGYTYYKAIRGEGEIPVPEFTINPSSTIKLGDVIELKTIIKCPWGRTPEKAELNLADGIQIVNGPDIKRIGTAWGKSKWEITAEIQPYHVGKIKKSDCTIEISREKEGKTVYNNLKGEIPGFEILAVDTKNNRNLDVASKAREPYLIEKNKWMFALVIIVLVISFLGTLVSIYIWYSKRKKKIEAISLSPWQLALSLLKELRSAFKDNKIKGQICVSRLSDIVRNYLEQRFNIHAPTQTTQEFLYDLDKNTSPMETEHKQFLRDFMTASDMVKFAKLPADDGLLENAISKAEQLVASTTPEANHQKIEKGDQND